jgi:hypothetical protein
MEYKNTWADNRMIRKMENDERNMLSKFYNLKKSDTNCPKNPYLLQPERLHLTSYEVLPDNRIKLNVGYMRNWSGYVSSTVRMNYNQYILGTLYCEEVEFVNEVDFNKKGTTLVLKKTKKNAEASSAATIVKVDCHSCTAYQNYCA